MEHHPLFTLAPRRTPLTVGDGNDSDANAIDAYVQLLKAAFEKSGVQPSGGTLTVVTVDGIPVVLYGPDSSDSYSDQGDDLSDSEAARVSSGPNVEAGVERERWWAEPGLRICSAATRGTDSSPPIDLSATDTTSAGEGAESPVSSTEEQHIAQQDHESQERAEVHSEAKRGQQGAQTTTDSKEGGSPGVLTGSGSSSLSAPPVQSTPDLCSSDSDSSQLNDADKRLGNDTSTPQGLIERLYTWCENDDESPAVEPPTYPLDIVDLDRIERGEFPLPATSNDSRSGSTEPMPSNASSLGPTSVNNRNCEPEPECVGCDSDDGPRSSLAPPQRENDAIFGRPKMRLVDLYELDDSVMMFPALGESAWPPQN